MVIGVRRAQNTETLLTTEARTAITNQSAHRPHLTGSAPDPDHQVPHHSIAICGCIRDPLRPFQILMDHLKVEEALLVADSYCNSRYPYSDTMAALNKQYR